MFLSQGQSSEEIVGLKLNALWDLPPDEEETNYWLKPIGSKEEPILPERKFGRKTEYLHFSKTKPSGVKPNDILIAYGVGAKSILTVYKSKSKIERVTRKDIKNKPKLERWPWYVKGVNLTPSFGDQWAKHNLIASSLVREYLKKNPDGFITQAKGKNLNALMYGIDKIKLHPDFGRFIVRKVNRMQNMFSPKS